MSGRSGVELIVLGFVVIGALFVLYGRYQDPELLTPNAIDSIQRIAYGFYITLIAALGAISFGLHKYHKTKITQKKNDMLSVIAVLVYNKRSKKVFTVTFVAYGIFFALVSGTLVYQPEINFVIHYGAVIPSGFVAPCCDDPGYMPKVIVYLTEHVGLQIIPINLVLQVIVSYLVALNAAIIVNVYDTSNRDRGVGILGAATGLFIACPTCAGTFLSIFVGTASGIALSVALAQLQTVFIAISIPVLLVTPYIMARKLQDTCVLD